MRKQILDRNDIPYMILKPTLNEQEIEGRPDQGLKLIEFLSKKKKEDILMQLLEARAKSKTKTETERSQKEKSKEILEKIEKMISGNEDDPMNSRKNMKTMENMKNMKNMRTIKEENKIEKIEEEGLEIYLVTGDSVVTMERQKGKIKEGENKEEAILEKPATREEARAYIESYSEKSILAMNSCCITYLTPSFLNTCLQEREEKEEVKGEEKGEDKGKGGTDGNEEKYENEIKQRERERESYLTTLPSESCSEISRINWKYLPPSLIEELIDHPDILYCAGGLMIEHPSLPPYIESVAGGEEAIQGLSTTLLNHTFQRVIEMKKGKGNEERGKEEEEEEDGQGNMIANIGEDCRLLDWTKMK